MARGPSLRAGEGPRSRGACEARGSRWSPPPAFERQRRRRVGPGGGDELPGEAWSVLVVLRPKSTTDRDDCCILVVLRHQCSTCCRSVLGCGRRTTKGRTNPKPA